MDKIVDHLFVFEGQGKIKDFPGNYSDYRDWFGAKEKAYHPSEKKDKVVKPKPVREIVRKLSFSEKRELEQLENEIARLEEEKRMIETVMNSGNCPPNEFVNMSHRHAKIKQSLDTKEARWVELSEIENRYFR